MVNFWEMETEPPDMEFKLDPLLPLVEELGNVSLNADTCVSYLNM
jgi:hypothetical protein